MKRQPRILAGTAIGLLMASAPLSAAQLSETAFRAAVTPSAPIILAQAECEGEDCPPAQEQQKLEEEQQPAPETEAAPEPQPESAPESEPQPEAAPEPEPEPQPTLEPEPMPEAEPAQEAAPPAEPQPDAEAAPAEEQAPAAEEATPEQPVQPEPGAEEPAEQQQPAQPDAQPETMEQQEQPAEVLPEPQPSQAPAAGEQPEQSDTAGPDAQPGNPDAAPILDSQKEAAPDQREKKRRRDGAEQDGQAAQPVEPVDQGPPPATDAAATEAAQPARIEAVTEEKGTRRDRAPDDEERRRRERPEGVDVLREIGDRIIIQLNNQVIVESNDRPRMTRGARDVYYEDLPRGRVRETILRDNGVRIVTIRNRYGDVIRRSRIMPDGREYVLVYVDDDNFDRVREWRDPGLDLPPMRLNIPRNRYILESEYVDDPNDYYEFLEQPPVERVQRLYSVDEVKRSARVRDIARRVDLDTLTFEFGSASIPENQVRKLEGVARAMEKLLDRNPAETFLIEGHTDAVGSDVANLALSDRRAESVADALTNVFGIPPENLATQGYGERYLKVKTEEPERENRRVAIRRITPLVAPVASAN
ncbi:OmpA family protein [Mesorhizobium sp. ZMM04-5]|uniref:OmpA family protein n=1 Tax=Mesorhizobium marinum TaxID=3228790 RepID=A0ABV3QUA9_9HYPH